MPKKQNDTKGGSGKALRWTLFCLAIIVAVAVAYAVYDKNAFSDFVAEKIPQIPLIDKVIAVKKPDKPEGGVKDMGGGSVVSKSMKDVLGAPEFTDAKSSIQAAVLRNNTPEQSVKTALPVRTLEPETKAATPAPAAPTASAAAPAPQPAPRLLPQFPKTNAPTLNFTAEPQQLAMQQQPAAQQQAAAPVAPPPPPPPPPPKPRATLLLQNVSGRLSDRADINVNMSVELTYEISNALREEVEFKRDMLSTLASSVIRRHEYGSINTAALKTEVLSVFNEHLQAGKISDVEIKNFQVAQD